MKRSLRNLAQQLLFRLLLAALALVASATVSSAFDVWGDNGSTPIGTQTNTPPTGTNTPPPCNPNKCPADPNCNAGDPVYPANGKFYLQLKDYELAGEIPIVVSRLYSTLFTYNGIVGYGWNLGYNERLYRLANGNLALRRDNDVTDEFASSAPRVFRAPAGKYETITENLDGTYTLQKPDGTIRVYSNNGTLAKIENLKGNQLLLTYDPTGKWPINGISLYSHITNPIVIARDYRLTRIDQANGGVPNGRFAQLAYNPQGRLINVMLYAGGAPPLSLSYGYASNGGGDLISYTDVTGAAFQYGYDNLHRMTNFPTGGCSCRLGRNIYDSTNRVTRQTIGNTVIDFAYLVPGSQTKVTTHIYDDQTLQPLRDQIEYFYFTPSGKTSKHVVQMGQALDPAQGESDDIVTTYSYDPVTDALVSMTSPSGSLKILNYDSAGNVSSELTTNGAEVVSRIYQYDQSSHLIKQYVTSSLWPGIKFGQRASGFDASGRVVWEKWIGTNGTELVTTYQYQTVGDHEIATVTDPEGNRMARETDANGKLVREFDPDDPAYQTRYQYDDRGNPTNQIDALGFQTQYTYDELGRVTLKGDALGQENTYTYSGANLVREEIGRSGATPGRIVLHEYNSNNKRIVTYKVGDGMTNVWMRYGYDSDRNLIWEENAVELRTTFEYDAAGRRSVIVDVYGGRTTNTFDKAGNLVSSRNALGIETRMQYDLLSRLTNRIEALGTALQRQTGYRLDPVDNIVQTTRSDGSSTFYGYDAWGRLAQVSGTREYPVAYQYDENNRKTITTDGNGNATTNRYDKYGRLTSILHPDGAVEQFQYDLAGRLVALTDGNTNTTFLTFDALGRQVAESAPNSPNVTLYTNTYNPWNELIVRSNLMGGVERRSYDAFGRLTNSRDAAGLSLSLQYDAANRLVAVLWPAGSYVSNAYSGPFLAATRDRAGHWTGYAYDILGRRTVEVTSLGLTNTFDYDSLGRPALKSNSVGHVLRTDYDAFDQPIRITHPDGLIETVMYDAYGQVTNRFGAGQYPVMSQFDATGNRTNLIDGNANQTAWIHDKRNRVQRKLYVDGTSYDYSYDRNGNLRTRRDAKGVVTTYSYDVANRVTRIDYPTDQDVLFQYDALGRRTQMADESGTNRWYYDMAGRVLTNTQSRVNALLVYGYDSQGNRTKMSLNGFDTVYTYDAADRLSSISNTVGVFTYTWLPEANLVQAISYPNGAVVSNAYNRLGWLSDRRNLKADGNIVSSFTYGYDTLGLRTNVLFADGSRSSYAYDTVRQLTSAAGYLAGGSVNTNYQYLYAYDDAGNRTSMKQSGQLTTYYPNELNQYVVSVTLDGAPKVTTFAYDANGSLTQESSASSALSYSWDQENRLSIVTNGTHRTEFLYNGLSLRVESREYENGFIQETARYIYDGPLPVAEVDGANTLIRTYARGLDLSLGLETAGGIGGLLSLSEMHEGAIAYYFSDGNGNVVDLLAQDSSEAAHYEYDPFGDALVASGPLSQQPFQWSTKERIAQHRLTYFGQRYFGMRFARWLSRDPWYDEAYRSAYVLSNAKQKVSRCKRGGCLVAEVFEDANLYAFVRNDALNEVDYWGLMNTCLNEEAYRRCKEAAEKDLQTCFDNADRVFKTCMEGAERFNKECMKVCAKGPRDVRPICEWTCGKIKGIQEDLCAAIRFGAYPGCRINYIDRLQSCREDAEYTVPDDCPCR